MALEDKKFQSKETGDVVKIVNDSGVFYSLSNGINIRKDNFFNKFTEVIDANSFFDKPATLYEDLASKINKIDTSKISDVDTGTRIIDRTQDSLIESQTPLQTKEELLRQYNESQRQRPDVSQYKVFDDDDAAAEDFLKRVQPQQPQQSKPKRQPTSYDPYSEEDFDAIPQGKSVEQLDDFSRISRQTDRDIVSKPMPYVSSPEEESFKFFKSFKRIHPIKLSVDFDEKIADPTFIKMMSMNFEGDIIKYYTKEIMNRVQNDPGYLEDRIYNKLKILIMGEEKPPRKPRSAKVVIPEPIIEKKTRKPRNSKKDVKSNG